MPPLPAHANLDQLRRQAKDLLRAASSGDADALQDLARVSDRVTLSAAQLALARSYGFDSWPKLKAEVEARTLGLARQAEAFCRASISDGSGRAARMLEATPELATCGFATAVVLGDAGRVRSALEREPGLATRVDPLTGWTPLHAAGASRWHQFEPERADGLLAVARLLLAAGAEPTAATRGWSPLRCVIASSNSGPSNRQIAELLLAHGAVPDDHDLYLAGFAHDRLELLPLLVAHVPDVHEIAEQALAAPLSNDDVETARLLLEAGADPNRYRNDDGEPVPVLRAAIRAGCSAAFVELLLRHGADGPESGADMFLSACLRADRDEAQRIVAADPGLVSGLTGDERATLVRAAGSGNTPAVAVMLELGVPLETRGDDGATALHAAAYGGKLDAVRLLLERGADVEARDTTWDSTPLVWANVGRDEHRGSDSTDWDELLRLLEAG
jgi:ankyrin repeat protein